MKTARRPIEIAKELWRRPVGRFKALELGKFSLIFPCPRRASGRRRAWLKIRFWSCRLTPSRSSLAARRRPRRGSLHSLRSFRSPTLRPPANPRVLGFALMGGRNVSRWKDVRHNIFSALYFVFSCHPWHEKPLIKRVSSLIY